MMATIRKGNAALDICSRLTFPILEAMKRQTPTGGVLNPMIKFSTKIAPK
jgi:hypothetical protein